MFWQARTVLFIQFLLYTLLWLYQALILFRITITFVKYFAPYWFPKGWVAVLVESLLIPTDPPINAMRKICKPLNFGGVSLDLSILFVFIIVRIAMDLVSP